MQRIVIYRWFEGIENKKEITSKLEEVKKISLKSKFNFIVLPPIIYLDFLKTKYKGKKISFCLDNFKNIFSSLILKDLNIKLAFFGFDYQNKKIKSYLFNNIDIIFSIGDFDVDEDGEFFDVLTQQLDDIFDNLNKKNKNNIYLIFSHLNEELSEQSLERIFIFIKKKINEDFEDSRKKIRVFYKINNLNNFSICEKLDSLDGVYIDDNKQNLTLLSK